MGIEDLREAWDLVIIGGGITGAGVFREATRMNLNVLLVERMDFAWGTSSRSTKLVHGGLRYLKDGHPLLTKTSVEERERMLKEAPGLVEQVGFLMPVYRGISPGKWSLDIGLILYDLMAHEKQHRFYDTREFSALTPHLKRKGLAGGFRFFDAQVDDARLVLRLINEAVAAGGCALNYTAAREILRNDDGQVAGVVIEDTETLEKKTLSTGAVINATGAWGEELHPSPDRKRHLRPLRGSHLVFPRSVIPIEQAVTIVHPADNRPVFAIPWEGAVLVGTTDVDYKEDIQKEPSITEEEISYLLEAIQLFFPSLDVSEDNCVSTFAGIRPVLSEGNLSPSEESRDYVVWKYKGLVTVTGGKLTTFRKMAWDTLKAAKAFLPPVRFIGRRDPVFSPVPDRIPEEDFGLSAQTWRRLYGRYGEAANELAETATMADLKPIPDTLTLWAELPFAAKHEQVRHLSDLLLRRVRIGLLTPMGGKEYIKRVQKLCESSLPWDRKRWKQEIKDYLDLWRQSYSIPNRKKQE
ncbi:MAG: glycerol-3-phosphate dehydrogenase/oxidase [Syntrophobacterales bacterium]|nr:glycerol-3-phosphate dehydrogenase/oxidase [Syntrophobacterales bacterium]